jgi:glutamate carboxypeptidase
MRKLLCAALLAAAATAAHAQLSDTEQRIVASVKQHNPAALQLLERSVRVNSGTLNPEGVREVGRIFAAELEALGFTTRWAEMPPEMHRAGHLVATHEGHRGKRVLIIGHLDTVFEKNSPVIAWDPRGERVRGQGVNDMKGGDVIAIEALRALKDAGALDDAAISIIFTGDEERAGSPLEIARKDMIDLAKQSDVALAFEGSIRREHGGVGQDMASYSRRSSGGWTLKVTGKPGHSGQVFRDNYGYGAIYEAARIINAFRENLIEENLTFNVGTFAGGTQVTSDDATSQMTTFGKTNVIAKEAIVKGDLRYLTPEQGERVKARMREIVAKSLPHTSAQIAFQDSYPPHAPTEAGKNLLEMYSKASIDAGFGPIGALPPADRGAGDLNFVAPIVTGIDGLGAHGTGSHTDNEDLEIASIERGTIRAAILIYRLTR